MTLPDWAKDIVCGAIEQASRVQHGKIVILTELSYSNGGLGSIKTRVSSEECHRPPVEKARK